MAENKQYITHVQENGKVLISEEVVASIVSIAVKDVEGVVNPGAKGHDKMGKMSWGKGTRIAISEENEISVDCNIIVAYGQSVVSVAKAVQESISSSIESMTGVKPVSVNVNVSGIVRQ